MKIIDFHTHVYPEKIALKATKNICDFYELEGHGMTGTVENLLERGKAAGIEKFVILPVALKPEYVMHVNDLAREEADAHPELIPFGTVHAEMDNMISELERIGELGLHGIKIHPDTQLFSIDDKRLYPMYEWLRANGLPIILHTGDPRHDYSRPEKLKTVLKDFPGLISVAAHFGGWSLFHDAYKALGDTDCYIDVSSSMMNMTEEEIYMYLNAYGEDRILFGSDFPLWDPEKELDTFLNLKISDNMKEKILYKNAEKILGIKI